MFFNPDVLDYISFPTHKIEEGEVESYDDGLIDGDEANSDNAMLLKRPKTKEEGENEMRTDVSLYCSYEQIEKMLTIYLV